MLAVVCDVSGQPIAPILKNKQSISFEVEIDKLHLKTSHVVERHASLRHAATSPNLYNDVILPSVLT